MLSKSFRIGTISGVDIKVHPTFSLIFVWGIYQWSVVAGAGLRGVIFGILVLLGVFLCVLAHELAHAIVATRHELEVKDITLLPIGGVARINHQTLTPRLETVVAVAGPLMNLLIAGALTPIVLSIIFVTSLGEALGYLIYPDRLSAAEFTIYIWIANLVLAAFNLIPAFPMDGGRVLRAQLSRKFGHLRATQIAVSVGQAIAMAIAIIGIVTQSYQLLLITIFILAYAHFESRYVTIESRLRLLPVGQFALWDTGGISPQSTLAYATRGGPRDLVVTEDGRVVGMLWRRDVLRHLNGHHHELTVRDIMDRQFYSVEVDDSIFDVHNLLSESQRSAVPVVDSGYYRGIFTGERLAHVYDTIGVRHWHGSPAELGTFLRKILKRLRLA